MAQGGSHRQERFSFAGGSADEAPAPAGARSLRLVASPGRPLTKSQKKFDRLLRKIESLRAERERATARWDAFVKIYTERIHPEERRMLARRKQVVLLLAAHWRKPKGLGKRQREQLTALLLGHLRALVESGPELVDDEVRALWAELQGSPGATRTADPGPASDRGEPASSDAAGIPPELVDLIVELGLDPTAFHAGMSHEEVAAEILRQMQGGPGGGAAEADDHGAARGEGHSARPKSARQEAAERKAAERVAQREDARKRTVVSIYKQLAKVLHPDLEQDAALRERKHALMQELTKAYREGDLHTLLRLELDWITREEGNLEQLGEEKLGIYSELLEEQVEELQAEIRDVPLAPRFAAVARYMRPFGQGPQDVESILLSIRRLSEALKRFRDEISGAGARAALREALGEVAAQQREQERWHGFMGGFGPSAAGGF